MLSANNVDKLRDAFRDLHPTHRMTPQRISFLENPDRGTALQDLYLQTDLGALDLLSSVMGVGDYERVVAGSMEIELFGHRVRVIGIEDLIRAKEALGREKDVLAVKELRAIVEKSRG